ncbi:MAG: nucleotidyltransferase family protein [Candidatus Tectomicrobia bacterium]|uniref:Nucleotidyltransferase family protein n=1 Tax=Tectimicrobiota bacterium TaxID=2528274 RepID=A0A932MQ68_UNCTE|nr:nucleotidyltransferase family protein [Candidatus Tectomicrobia bacterium]
MKALEPRRAELRRLGVKRLALFGSSVRGDAEEKSDLDFLVELDPKSFDAYMDVKFFLEDLFGRKVDLVLADALKPRLRPRILAEAVDVPLSS